MPRVSNEPNITSKNGRAKLKKRREPYFRTIVRPGAGDGLWLRLGYRSTSGTWIAQVYDPEKTGKGRRLHQAIGAADDAADGGGLSYSEAETAARAWFRGVETAAVTGAETRRTYAVADAMDDYFAAYKSGRTKHGGKAPDRLRSVIDSHIKPALGHIRLSKLTKTQIRDWHRGLATSAPRVRPKLNAEGPRFREMDDSPEGIRRRQSTANRLLTNLKAALTYAYHEGRIASDAAWRDVKPFREADAARVRYLSDDETRRLVNACGDGDFRQLVVAALMTGCRYGELARLHAGDFNPDSRTVHVRESKSGKPRHVVLTDEGAGFFDHAAAGKAGIDVLFPRGNRAWRASEQQRPLADACRAAKIEPAISFHVFRHTYASRLIMRGAPLMVVAQQLGHTDTRMVEKHYGHLSESYVAETVRAAFGAMGIAGDHKVIPLRDPKHAAGDRAAGAA